jgi:hypothetical protein
MHGVLGAGTLKQTSRSRAANPAGAFASLLSYARGRVRLLREEGVCSEKRARAGGRAASVGTLGSHCPCSNPIAAAFRPYRGGIPAGMRTPANRSARAPDGLATLSGYLNGALLWGDAGSRRREWGVQVK